MSALRALPLRLPARQLVAGPPPSFTSEAQVQERRWVTLGLGVVAGALFVLFSISLVQDATGLVSGGGPRQVFDDVDF